MTRIDSFLLAKAKATRFQEEVQRYVKRHNPIDLAVRLAVKIAQVSSNPNRLMSQWPIHFLIHAVEAGCAYYRKCYNDPVTDETLRKIINTYHTYYDPMSEYLLTQSNRLDIFFAMYARQQFYLQEPVNRHDAARGILLFDEASYPETSELCRQRYGFGFRDWITFCFGLHAGLLNRNPPIIGPQYFSAVGDSIVSHELMPKLFEVLSATVDEVGESYRLTREKYGLVYDPYFPSFFTKKPLLALDTGDYLAPHKGLVMQKAVEGLFDLGKDNWTKPFGLEFGSAFEKYVGSVLAELPDVHIYPERDIRNHTEKKVCDYIIVGQEFVLLLECKAVEYSAAMSSEGAIRGDNSTTKIAKAVDQLFSTAQLIMEGELSQLLGEVKGRTVLGAVVTFRHIYMVNDQDYWQKAILPQVKSLEANDWSNRFMFCPQTLDVSELEQLVILSSQTNTPLLQFFQDKLSQSEYHVGEWNAYLGKKVPEGHSLGVLEGVFEGFMDDVLRRMTASQDADRAKRSEFDSQD